MAVTLKTRKPVDKLSLDDLSVFPIWEYCLDEEEVPGRDETWVRPVRGKVLATDMWSMSVAADFETASGKRFEGFIDVTTADGITFGSAVLLVGHQYVFVHEVPEQREYLESALQMRDSEIFPLAFALRVVVHGETNVRTGTLAAAAG